MTGTPAYRICARLEDLAARDPGRPAVLAPDLALPFGNLLRLARCYAARLQAEGIRPGDLVSLATGDTIAAISSVFALSFVGARYIPYSADLLHPGAPGVDVFLRTPEAPGAPGRRELVIDNGWSPRFAADDGSATRFDHAPEGQDIAWLLPSSGTTGRTKHVEISHDLLERRLRTIAADYAEGDTRLLQLFHCASRAFMIRAIAALVSGNTVVEPGPLPFVRKAGVNFVCGSPQQVRLWLADNRISPRIPLLQVSGAKLTAALATRLLDSFDCVEDVYGANETIKSHVNTYRRADQGLDVAGKPGSGVEIVSETGAACPTGTAGYIRVRTDAMVAAYVNDAGATAQHFRDGWFHPGDLGVFDARNVLTIVGRESDVVNIEGDKILLSDIEEHISAVEGVEAASCFEHAGRDGVSRIAACLCLARPDPEVPAAARAACERRFGPLAAPVAMLVVPALERTADGVVRRGRARDLFDGTLATGDPDVLRTSFYNFGDRP